ncbi:choice-of-anchor D domain-containing protein [Paraburkholderia hospita]|uniref:choice-of-anchor D domain-containing protein n=1 Tax=Paraburkholderia hospita TaxID=169430 RepID=UPI003ECD6C95
MSLNGTVWAPIGPSPINQGSITANGQVTAIAVHPSNPSIIYIGTAWGGVWMRNGGAAWTPIFDRAPALGIGEPAGIAIDPVDPNVIYVGTSNRDGSQFSGEATQPPAGLFKSTDGGGSWVRLGSGYPSNAPSNANQFFGQVINVVIVDPANHLVVYLATNTCVFVSGDGGLNWTQGALPGIVDVRSLVLDPTSPAGARILYAGVTGAGIFQSKDGGQTWTLILSGATPVVANELCPVPPCVPGRSVGKFIVALAPPTSPPAAGGIQVLYATMEGQPLNRPRQPTDAPDPVGVFRSTDQGLTWTLQTPTGSGIPPGSGMPLNTQGGYSFHMSVDPASPGDGSNDIIYFGAVVQARSTDSGLTFVPLSGLHADTHAWTFVRQPGPFSIVYCGNDGGIYRSSGGTAFTSLNGDGLQTALFYNLDVKRDPTASVTLGALQDNGIVTNALPAIFPAWTDGVGGDGFDVAHDGQNATKVYGRSNANIFGSTTDGNSYSSISPPWASAESDVYLSAVAVDPSTDGTVYAGSNANLWQSTDSGATWPKKVPIPGTANEVDVAAANNNNVVVAVGGRVLVSTNALGAYTLTNITRDLPGRFVSRVAFDPNDAATIYAVLGGFSGFPGGHVFRTTLLDTTWTDISPPLDLPFNAIALDGSGTPPTIYAGTDFGVLRSVDGGANWGVLDDLHFPRVPVFELVFHAGELRAATFGRGVFSFIKPTGPVIAVSLSGNLAFGTVCRGSTQYQTITVHNVGVTNLLITSVQRLMGSSDFTVPANPGTPLSLAPGEEIAFTVAFSPTGAAGPEAATIRIITNDPNAPVVDMLAKGTIGSGRVSTAIAQAGSFGDVCLGSKADQLLTINNRGRCPLSISSIIGSPDFHAPSVLSYPLLVGAGASIDVVVRFQPSAPFGAKVGTIRIVSDDPAGPHVVSVSGFVPAPKANLMTVNTGSFGDVCVGSFADEPLIVTNSGKCMLSVTGVSSTSDEFLVPEVLSYPIAIGPGDALPVPIRFKPLSFGAKAATITVTSDDPTSPISINVSGEVPSGKLTVTGSTSFGGVSAGCCADRTLSICNTGDCALRVTSVHFLRRSRRWKLLNNPFPATLPPGSCLPVVVQYRAGERCPRPCELVIESNDPVTLVKRVEVLAYTIWEGCGEDCSDRALEDDDCRRDRCGKCPPCRQQGYPCCDDDDDDER